MSRLRKSKKTYRFHTSAVVNPGDKLILAVDATHWSNGDLAKFVDDLRKALPEIEYIVVDGVQSMAVVRSRPKPAVASEPVEELA